MIIVADSSPLISLAIEKELELLLIDDAKGRRMAKHKGLSIIGSVGILIKAKRKGLIQNTRGFMDVLISNGIRIGPELYFKALELSDEK